MSKDIEKKKSDKKQLVIILAIAVGAVIVSVGAMGVAFVKAKNNAGSYTEVVNPIKGDVKNTIAVTGSVSSSNMTTYSSPVTADVEDLDIKPGQLIKKGDTILSFNTESLENNYEKASLNAQSTTASNQDTIAKANEAAADVANAKTDVEKYKSQIAAKQAELDTLTASSETDTTLEELQTKLTEKRTRLFTLNTEMQNIITTNPNKFMEDATYIADKAEADSITVEIENIEAMVGSMDNGSTVSSAIESITSEIASLQAKLESAQAIADSGADGALTSGAKTQMNISSKLSQMDVIEAAEDLEEGKQGIKADWIRNIQVRLLILVMWQ